jgi:hypothetical protein
MVSSDETRALHTNLGTLFTKVNVQINSFQHDLLHKEIVNQITHLLARDPDDPASGDAMEDREDPRVDELLSRISKLEETIMTIEDRLSRIERLSVG